MEFAIVIIIVKSILTPFYSYFHIYIFSRTKQTIFVYTL